MCPMSILLLLPIIIGVLCDTRGNQDDLTCDGTKSDCVSSTKQNLASANEETQLFKDLFSSYGTAERATRGVDHHGDKMSSTFGLKIISLSDMDTTNGIATINAWFAQTWSDTRLTWDPSAYDGAANLRVPREAMWKPDIAHYNTISTHKDSMDENTVVYSTGQVLWMPQVTVKAPCHKKASNDGQAWTCELKYGSWTYDGNQIDLDFYEGKKEIDLDFFTEMANGYTVKSLDCEKHTKHYPGVEEPYTDLTFSFSVSKK